MRTTSTCTSSSQTRQVRVLVAVRATSWCSCSTAAVLQLAAARAAVAVAVVLVLALLMVLVLVLLHVLRPVPCRAEFLPVLADQLFFGFFGFFWLFCSLPQLSRATAELPERAGLVGPGRSSPSCGAASARHDTVRGLVAGGCETVCHARHQLNGCRETAVVKRLA